MSSRLDTDDAFSFSTENGLKSAERITEALYSKSADSLARLQPSELRETFRGAAMIDILLQPATSVLDMVMKANCFANESKDKNSYPTNDTKTTNYFYRGFNSITPLFE